MTSTTYAVEGMTCDHCVAAVRSELTRLDGVSDVEVDLGSGAVTITSRAGLDPDAVRAAVEEAGYRLRP